MGPQFTTLESAVIELNEVENILRKLLSDVADFIEKNPVPKETSAVPLPDDLAKAPLELRFTGGWVRDKLLGVPSHDIDVAINKMTGYQFGLRMKDYLDSPGNAEKYGLGGVTKKAGSLTKIDANPEKSKHLETVTTKILGLDLDLVNLRKETYTDDSRNPQVEFGSPEEDALRRDACINAMFYNITTSKIEDFTGRGFYDLQNHIIRTPLDPYTTFKDDPLRVLRLIRFASRLGYEIEGNTRKFMANEEISEALKMKITKERVFIEVEKMLKGPDPRTALQLIDGLNLYHTVFVDPDDAEIYNPDTKNWSSVYEALQKMIHSEEEPHQFLYSTLIQSQEEKFLSWMLTAMIPWADAPELPSKKGKAQPPMVTIVAIAALKAPSKITDLLTACVRNMKEIREMKDKGEQSREVLGMAIRRWGALWRQQVMFALLYEIFTSPSAEENTLKSYTTFLKTIETQNLMTVYDLKPLIDGTKLAAALSAKPGPWMKGALDIVMSWQLRNPTITDPAAAVEEVRLADLLAQPASKKQKQAQKQKKGELTSLLITHFLRLTLRPLFAQAPKNDHVTAQGRKKIGEVLPKRFRGESILFDEERKVWIKEAWSLELLRWVCGSLDGEIVEREWGFLIPPILTVVDDTDVKVRAKGAELLRLLLGATPPLLLKRTGLAPLFEESLYISATYLPTLTAEEDSITILNATVPALLTLANTAHPAPTTPSSDPTAHESRTKALDKILRKGILFPHTHSTEYIHITQTLLSNLPPLLSEMGIDSVKHLQVLIPLLSNILADPLGPAYPPLLLTAAKGMESVILNGWPRIGRWRAEIYRGICICWIRLAEDGGGIEGVEDVEMQLRVVASVLREAVEGDVDVNWTEDVQVLVGADERLQDLLKA
ncbi:tRNA nucleotidyltransferase [Tothia fuscella]|uniref:tRNA nucleotidyltransferase n=1 Tax=Tothia fuscella TaxID=1048955 RepID=A0A9P4NWG8_9PEZI|nr:tRNA nucleotidyltransferase [Tothia fuscella]